MNKNTLFVLMALIVLIASGSFLGARYLGLGKSNSLLQPQSNPGTMSDSASTEAQAVSWRVEKVAENLEVPWSIAFTDSDRILVTERPGRLRQVVSGQLVAEPLHTFNEVQSSSEEGLMGLALDPEYQQNRFVYASLAYLKDNALVVKVIKFRDQGNSITDISILLDGIPAARNHAGNRLRFGPDGKLFVTTGDATQKELAQDLNSLAGKILRLNPDGTVPSDNPFPNSLIYSYGHRNPQGLDWHPVTKALIATEHGPSLFDGPAGGDEVNGIQAGQNYGWPLVSHTNTKAGTISPLQVYTPAEAPASGVFYSADLLPQFKNNYFFGALKGQGLVRLVFDEQDQTKIVGQEKLFNSTYGRIRDVAVGPEGALYFTTSNRDGRGKVQSGDDKIYRLLPQ